jgi:hypothetical protein
MDERRVQDELAARRQQLRRRRAKRGVVAGYIHEISGRHWAAATDPKPVRSAVPAP